VKEKWRGRKEGKQRRKRKEKEEDIRLLHFSDLFKLLISNLRGGKTEFGTLSYLFRVIQSVNVCIRGRNGEERRRREDNLYDGSN
jgi:hypothetical protein